MWLKYYLKVTIYLKKIKVLKIVLIVSRITENLQSEVRLASSRENGFISFRNLWTIKCDIAYRLRLEHVNQSLNSYRFSAWHFCGIYTFLARYRVFVISEAMSYFSRIWRYISLGSWYTSSYCCIWRQLNSEIVTFSRTFFSFRNI